MELFGLFAGVVLLYVVFKLSNSGIAKKSSAIGENLLDAGVATSASWALESSKDLKVDEIKAHKEKINQLLG